MNFIQNLKISHKLYLGLSVFVAGFLLFGVSSFSMLNQVEVNGPIYNEIVRGKDLVADILPPPEYIIESYLTVLEMQESINDSKKIEELTNYFTSKLKKEFYERHEYWSKDAILLAKNNDLRETMNTASYRLADDFYKIVEKEYFPALRNKDINKVSDLFNNKLKPLYYEHRKYIDNVVTKATKKNESTEASAAHLIKMKTINLIILFVVTIIISFSLFVMVALSITRPVNQIVNTAGILAEEDLKNITDVLNAASSGDFSRLPEIKTEELTIRSKDEVGILATTFNQMITKFKVSGNAVEQFINAVKSLAADANMLSNAAVEGKLGTRADASKHNGEFGKIVQGVNRTIDSLVGLIDAMPMPAMIIDKNLNIRYMNTAGLSLGKTTLDRLAGTPCSQYFKTGDCETGMCACKRALDEGIPCNSSTIARPTTDLSLEIDYTGVPIKSETGEIVGIFEFAIDQTAIRNAQKKAQKLSDYQTHEVSKVQTNLEKIARGELAIELKTEEPDSDTVEAKRTFDTINTAISGVVTSIGSLVSDAGMLSKAAVEGKLATRADASKHQGDYRKVVHGVNNTLDAVITPINEAQSVLEKVARRDLTARMCGNYNGDMAKIKNAINSAVDNIDKALLQVTEATVQVTSASGQISSGSQSLAQGTNEQASSLEEVSSSLVEMESKTKQNADNANQAKLLAGESDTNAKSGAEAMYMMSSAINRIKESSDQTAKIVKTIDEIAMQTNLLALNAAVEAARAGEAGRGFAVVAEEVRNLAQRSAQAAKNTADMITESVKNADDGVKIATEVSQSFETIASSAKKVNDLIAEIAAASQEQSAGIEQINTAVAQMDKVTQQNAANSEESASAAEELSSQAEELKNMISQFTLSHNT